MSIKGKTLINNRTWTYITSIFTGIVALFFVLVISMNGDKSKSSLDGTSIYDWSDDWIVSAGSIKGEVMQLPVRLEVERGKTVIIKKTLPNMIKKYNCIMYNSKRQDVIVNVGGVLRTAYTDKEERGFGKSSPDSIVIVPLYSTDADKDVTILISTNSNHSGEIGEIYFGNEMSIIMMLIKTNVIWIAIIVAIFIMSIASLISFFIYRNNFEESGALLHLFWLALMAGMWCFGQLTIRQIFIAEIRLHDHIGYLFFMLLPASVAEYSNLISKYKYSSVFHMCSGVGMINFIVQNILQLANIYDYNSMTVITLQVFSIVLLVALLLCGNDMFTNLVENIVFVWIGVFVLFVMTVIVMQAEMQHWGNVVANTYSIGFLVFLITNGLYVFTRVSKEQQLKKDAESASQAKSLFLATMSHEIRTPINAVIGMNEMIMRDTNDPQIKEYSESISDAGKSLLALVNDVLDFSKIESGKMDIVCSEYEMKPCLNEMLTLIRARMSGKNLRLNLDIDENIPSVCYGDEVRIKQVLTNILTNAVKYTREGSITLSVKNMGITDDMVALYFSVKDTGIGILPEDIDKILNSSFIRVDSVKNKNIEGTGLGISITRQLLKLMGSKLEVDSEYGKGSDFHFIIKQKIVDAEPMGSLISRRNGKTKEKKISFKAPKARILAVDDTNTNLIVVKGLLKPYECIVDVCESGPESIEACRNNKYDVIFMDHMMPEMDGIETVKRLKKEQGLLADNTKIVALTANVIHGIDAMYYENGFDGFLSKPIDVKELDECLRKHLPKEYIIEG